MERNKTTSLYRHFNDKDELLYIGVSLSTLTRLGQHRNNSNWFNSITKVTIEPFDTRQKALSAEEEAIILEKPLHNIIHNGGKKGIELINNLSKRKENSELFLIDNIVNINIIYTIDQVSSATGFGKKRIQKFIDDKILGSIILRRNFNKYYNKEIIKRVVTGWQLIDFIEYITEKGDISEMD